MDTDPAPAAAAAATDSSATLDRPPADILSCLQRGDIHAATSLLRERQAAAVAGLSILEDVFPLALTNLAELYDRHGVTGREGPYFELARELWSYMPDAEREIPDMVCTFLYAGCKFNQPDFVRWVLPIVARHRALSIAPLVTDRMYEHNQLRHSAIYYVAKNGSVELYNMLAAACGGASPLVLEAALYERHHAVAVATSSRPPLPTAATVALASIPVTEEAAAAGGTDAVMKRADEPDPPALYTAVKGGHAAFLRHVLGSLPAAAAARVLRCVVVNALIPLDDADAAAALFRVCAEPPAPSPSVSPFAGSGRSVSADGAALSTGGVGASLLLGPSVSRRGSASALVDRDALVTAFCCGRPGGGRDGSTLTSPARPRVGSSGAASTSSAGGAAGGGSTSALAATAAAVEASARTSSSASSSSSSTAFHAMHLCAFVLEATAEPHTVRWPVSWHYAEWLIGAFPNVALFPLPRMRWGGIGGAPTGGSGGSADGGVHAAQAHAAGGRGALVSAAGFNSASAGAPGLWSDWSPFLSACAAGSVDLARLIASRLPSAVTAPAVRIATAAPAPASGRPPLAPFSPPAATVAAAAAAAAPVIVHPIRVAVESAASTGRFDVVAWLSSSVLTYSALDEQLYSASPRGGLYAAHPAFVKRLCKATALSLRALRRGGGGLPTAASVVDDVTFTAAPFRGGEGGGGGPPLRRQLFDGTPPVDAGAARPALSQSSVESLSTAGALVPPYPTAAVRRGSGGPAASAGGRGLTQSTATARRRSRRLSDVSGCTATTADTGGAVTEWSTDVPTATAPTAHGLPHGLPHPYPHVLHLATGGGGGGGGGSLGRNSAGAGIATGVAAGSLSAPRSVLLSRGSGVGGGVSSAAAATLAAEDRGRLRTESSGSSASVEPPPAAAAFGADGATRSSNGAGMPSPSPPTAPAHAVGGAGATDGVGTGRSLTTRPDIHSGRVSGGATGRAPLPWPYTAVAGVGSPAVVSVGATAGEVHALGLSSATPATASAGGLGAILESASGDQLHALHPHSSGSDRSSDGSSDSGSSADAGVGAEGGGRREGVFDVGAGGAFVGAAPPFDPLLVTAAAGDGFEPVVAGRRRGGGGGGDGGGGRRRAVTSGVVDEASAASRRRMDGAIAPQGAPRPQAASPLAARGGGFDFDVRVGREAATVSTTSAVAILQVGSGGGAAPAAARPTPNPQHGDGVVPDGVGVVGASPQRGPTNVSLIAAHDKASAVDLRSQSQEPTLGGDADDPLSLPFPDRRRFSGHTAASSGVDAFGAHWPDDVGGTARPRSLGAIGDHRRASPSAPWALADAFTGHLHVEVAAPHAPTPGLQRTPSQQSLQSPLPPLPPQNVGIASPAAGALGGRRAPSPAPAAAPTTAGATVSTSGTVSSAPVLAADSPMSQRPPTRSDVCAEPLAAPTLTATESSTTRPREARPFELVSAPLRLGELIGVGPRGTPVFAVAGGRLIDGSTVAKRLDPLLLAVPAWHWRRAAALADLADAPPQAELQAELQAQAAVRGDNLEHATAAAVVSPQTEAYTAARLRTLADVALGFRHVARCVDVIAAASDGHTYCLTERADATLASSLVGPAAAGAAVDVPRGPIGSVLEATRDTLRALAALHSVGATHGALHADNVRVRRGVLKLTDAGLAEAAIRHAAGLPLSSHVQVATGDGLSYADPGVGAADDTAPLPRAACATIGRLAVQHAVTVGPCAAPEVVAALAAMADAVNVGDATPADVAAALADAFSPAADVHAVGRVVASLVAAMAVPRPHLRSSPLRPSPPTGARRPLRALGVVASDLVRPVTLATSVIAAAAASAAAGGDGDGDASPATVDASGAVAAVSAPLSGGAPLSLVSAGAGAVAQQLATGRGSAVVAFAICDLLSRLAATFPVGRLTASDALLHPALYVPDALAAVVADFVDSLPLDDAALHRPADGGADSVVARRALPHPQVASAAAPAVAPSLSAGAGTRAVAYLARAAAWHEGAAFRDWPSLWAARVPPGVGDGGPPGEGDEAWARAYLSAYIGAAVEADAVNVGSGAAAAAPVLALLHAVHDDGRRVMAPDSESRCDAASPATGSEFVDRRSCGNTRRGIGAGLLEAFPWLVVEIYAARVI